MISSKEPTFRQWRLAQFLVLHGTRLTTIVYITDRLHVSEMTVRRDVKALRDMGMDILADSHGYRLLNGEEVEPQVMLWGTLLDDIQYLTSPDGLVSTTGERQQRLPYE